MKHLFWEMNFPAALNIALFEGKPVCAKHINNPVKLLATRDSLNQLILSRVDEKNSYLDVWETFSDTDFYSSWYIHGGEIISQRAATDSPGTVGWALDYVLRNPGTFARPRGWKVKYFSSGATYPCESLCYAPSRGGPWELLLPDGSSTRATITMRSMRCLDWEIVDQQDEILVGSDGVATPYNEYYMIILRNHDFDNLAAAGRELYRKSRL